MHAGFRGMRAVVARKKVGVKLIGYRFVIPHDTIPLTLVASFEDSDNLKLKCKNEQTNN
jgi:hypothetical protein